MRWEAQPDRSAGNLIWHAEDFELFLSCRKPAVDVHRGRGDRVRLNIQWSLLAARVGADASTTSYNCHSFCIRTFKTCFLHDFDVCNTVLLTINVILGQQCCWLQMQYCAYFPGTYHTWNCMFVPFDKRFPISPPSSSWELPFHSVSTSWNFYIPPRSDIWHIQTKHQCLSLYELSHHIMCSICVCIHIHIGDLYIQIWTLSPLGRPWERKRKEGES